MAQHVPKYRFGWRERNLGSDLNKAGLAGVALMAEQEKGGELG